MENKHEKQKADLNKIKDSIVSKEVINQSNKSRRNDIVLYNVPGGEEKGDVWDLFNF